MLRGIDTQETVEFVSSSDTGENKTKFYIGNISNRDKLKIFTGAMNPDGSMNQEKLQDKTFDILKAGVKKITNLGGKDYTEITDDVLNSLLFPVMVELTGKILEFNFLGGAEAKN
jgi:hypothetical protein